MGAYTLRIELTFAKSGSSFARRKREHSSILVSAERQRCIRRQHQRLEDEDERE